MYPGMAWKGKGSWIISSPSPPGGGWRGGAFPPRGWPSRWRRRAWFSSRWRRRGFAGCSGPSAGPPRCWPSPPWWTEPGLQLDLLRPVDLIEEVATRLWVFTEDGIQDFKGTYEEFSSQKS